MVLLAAALLVVSAFPAALGAQLLTRPALPWRTLETGHFTFHFPAPMSAWTREVATRMEGVHLAVTRLVGFSPEKRVTVLVEDPSNVSNGFALPFRGEPTIFLWPTPPDPSSTIGHNRGWGELLAVHEFAHIAHLVRPSRNPLQRQLWALLPVDLGPIARRSPRWLTEGYATYVEGELTGSGRPASATRAAILRQWALEGQLPTYDRLDASRGFLGGSMAYLVGSTYLEWLVAREGAASLEHLWRRMTARADRGFDAAFAGVYGAPPAELYGQFTAQVTRRALAVEDSLAARGLAEGELVQRITSSVGAPAVSPCDSLIAIVLRPPTEPPRVVIWGAQPDSSAMAAADSAVGRLLELDPEDVPAVRRLPAPRRALHTLHAADGRAFDRPRFLPGGDALLVVRAVPQGDGAERPELFIWRFREGDVRRVTHGGAIREADPSPDGAHAAGVRCMNGICDLVRVRLSDGGVTLLAAGSPSRSFSDPRWAPDGSDILVSVHEGGRWRLALVPATGGEPLPVDPDDGHDRYGGSFLGDGRDVVATSEAGGVPHLERLSLETGLTRTLTRTAGAHWGAEVSPGGGEIYFLALHARGYDLRRIGADSFLPGAATPIAGGLWPAVPPGERPTGDSFPRASIPPDRPYGLGPRTWRLLPGFTATPDGTAGLLALNVTDPVGRLAWQLQGASGGAGTMRGLAITARLRAIAPEFRGDVFATRIQPSRGREAALVREVAGEWLDADYSGMALGMEHARAFDRGGYSLGVAASAGRLQQPQLEPGPRAEGRVLLAPRAAGTIRWRSGRNSITQRLRVDGAVGQTAGEEWLRALMTYDAAVRWRALSIRGSATAGFTDAGAPGYEAFALGGPLSPLLPAVLQAQRVELPALPAGTAVGTRMRSYRVETDLLGGVAYFSATSVGARFQAPWHRVVGLEQVLAAGPFPFAGVPSTRLLVGVAHSFDEPFARRTRLYGGVSFTP